MCSRINLGDFFDYIKNEDYCVLKFDGNLNYLPGSDLDILTSDISYLTDKIFSFLNRYLNINSEIKFLILTSDHYQIDFFKGDILELRFDLYQSLSFYKKVRVKEFFIYDVIYNFDLELITFDNKIAKIKKPNKLNDLIIRYLEFIEYYSIREDKIKHFEYVSSLLNKNNQEVFFNKLHQITKLRNLDTVYTDNQRNLKKHSKIKYYIQRLIFTYKSNGLVCTIKRTLKFVKHLTS